MSITIRPAKTEDAPAIARVHIASWQTSYRGLVPDDVLDNPSYERRLGYWEQVIGGVEALHFVYVAENERREVVGFTSGGQSREEALPYAGELYTLYLLESYKRQGLGTRLFRAAIDRFVAEGLASMMLWVFVENTPGRQFYEKSGGIYVTKQPITIGGKELLEVAYGWENLNMPIPQ
jgi:ribosomal protein S18 acetylase RimI-like enzyme